MQKIKQVFSWLDTHILEVLAYFLVVFIPLYPKLPLFEAIPGYIVRVRVEDILILITGVIWLVQLWRKKITWKTPLTWVIGAYAVTGLLSTLSGMLITGTIPFTISEGKMDVVHVAKSLLHYFRYLEYFFLFFVVVTSLKTQKHFKTLFILIVATVLIITGYGYGQRYYRFPLYSTMNREFSKGDPHILDQHGRIQSTFGGHYDLAAYLVVIIPLLLAAWYVFKSKRAKLAVGVTFFAGLWLLVQTSSRSSYLGFVIATYAIIAVYALYKPTWWKRIFTFLAHSTVYGVIIVFFTLYFGADMYERFLQTLRGYPELHERYHALNHQRKMALVNAAGFVFKFFVSEEKVAQIQHDITATPTPAPVATNVDPATAAVSVGSDSQPIPLKPDDVKVDVPVTILVATTSAEGVESFVEVEVDRTYSADAIQYGLSAAIRYDTLWPRAIAGFKRNPVLGSGYATLTKENNVDFTEAESTDNNFLRTLGETGALGFITFYGVIVIALKLAYDVLRRKETDRYKQIFVMGFIGSALGLLANAIYIDVFAASKVAFTFWSLVGVVTAAYLSTPKTATSTESAPGSVSSLAGALSSLGKPGSSGQTKSPLAQALQSTKEKKKVTPSKKKSKK